MPLDFRNRLVASAPAALSGTPGWDENHVRRTDLVWRLLR
jgi:hypothetical protein